MRTIQQQPTADSATAPNHAPLALPAPRATRQQVFWHILLQSLIYGSVGGLFLSIYQVLQDSSALYYFIYADNARFFSLVGFVFFTIFGGVAGIGMGMIGALLTFLFFYPMRSARTYRLVMSLIPLLVGTAFIRLLWAISSRDLTLFDFLGWNLFDADLLYMLWATQRITTSAIYKVGVVDLPYYRPAPYLIDPYLAESRRALFDMAPEIADRMEWLVGLGMPSRWRGALLARLDLRPGMRAVDLMAGTGSVSRALVRRVGAGSLTAVEFAPGVAARLRRVAGIDVVEADALTSGLPSGEADVVTCAFGTLGLRQVDQIRLADEVDRLLAPNGVVGLVDMTPPKSGALRWAYLAYLRFVVPAVARLFLKHPALYHQLHRYVRESVGLGPLAGALEARGYAVALAPLDGGLATALVAMKGDVAK